MFFAWRHGAISDSDLIGITSTFVAVVLDLFYRCACNQTNLILAIGNRPISSTCAYNIDLLQKRALVPRDTNLLYLALIVKNNDVSL